MGGGPIEPVVTVFSTENALKDIFIDCVYQFNNNYSIESFSNHFEFYSEFHFEF